ncbi:MAG TPA: hypothetical protein VJ877_03420 [Bacteroidales bacterium]|nr:hypothetical protein [Bacteroidales bacterium]
MKKNSKNNTDLRIDIIRYLGNRMSAEERNAFERKLQADPFLAEAVEGFTEVDPHDLEDDFEDLRKSISGYSRNKRIIVPRVAAAIVVLLGISSVLLVLFLRKPSTGIAENRLKNEAGKIELPVPEAEGIRPENTGLDTPGKQELKALPEKRSFEEITAEPEDSVLMLDEIITAQPKAEGIMDVEMAEAAIAEEEMDARPKGITVDNQAAKAARPETSQIELKKERLMMARAASEIETSRKARPSLGDEEYEKYIKENAVYPDIRADYGSVSVKLKVAVDTSGKIVDTFIVESPDKVFSDEAVRLVSEGPAWLPALKEGLAVRDTVSLEVVISK